MLEVTKGNINALEAYHIFEEAKKKDAISLKIVDNFCDNLAYGIGILLNIVNPEIIILAGGVSRAGNIIVEGIKAHLHKYALEMTSESLKFTFSELGDDAGIKGAAALIISENI